MKLNAICAIGALLTVNVAAQADPNVVKVAGPEDIPQQPIVIGNPGAVPPGAIPPGAAAPTPPQVTIPALFKATACPGEVKCPTDDMRVRVPVYNETITKTKTSTETFPTVATVLVKSYEIKVEADVEGRQGLCPIVDPIPADGPKIVWVDEIITETEWYVSYSTEVTTSTYKIGTISNEACVRTAVPNPPPIPDPVPPPVVDPVVPPPGPTSPGSRLPEEPEEEE